MKTFCAFGAPSFAGNWPPPAEEQGLILALEEAEGLEHDNALWQP